jgi:Fe2+ or Zn2+ uptake regulation protein
MTTAATTDRAKEIKSLHQKIKESMSAALKKSLPDAIQIGKLLTEQKAEMKHTEFGKWLDAKIVGPDISRATVNNYMKLFKEKGKILNVRNLAEAYSVLYRKDEEPKDRTRKLDERETPEGGKVTKVRVMEYTIPSEREEEVNILLTKLGELLHTTNDGDTIYEVMKRYAKEHPNVKDNSATDKAA